MRIIVMYGNEGEVREVNAIDDNFTYSIYPPLGTQTMLKKTDGSKYLLIMNNDERELWDKLRKAAEDKLE